MTSRTIVCSDCGEAVPYGRLSCPACGALLASVAGGARSPGSTADGATPDGAEPGPTLEPDPPITPASRLTPTSGGYLPPSPIPVTAPAPPAPVDPKPATRQAPASSSNRLAIDLGGLDAGLDRAVAVGAGIVAIGLLLPWSRVVIGGSGRGGYVDTWGLAGPAHVLALLVAVALVVAALVPNRIPAWIRSGAAGLAFGTFMLGIVWPYVVGPLGAGLGVLVEVVGALVLIVAGALATWRTRHEPDDAAV